MARRPSRTRGEGKRASLALAGLTVVIVLAVAFVAYWLTVGSRGGAGKAAPPAGAVAQRQQRMGMAAEMRSWRNPQDGLFHCPVCDQAFKLPGQLRGHMASQHPDFQTTASGQAGAGGAIAPPRGGR